MCAFALPLPVRIIRRLVQLDGIAVGRFNPGQGNEMVLAFCVGVFFGQLDAICAVHVVDRADVGAVGADDSSVFLNL